MDASQYKDYVLVLLFMKYVSDKYAGQKTDANDLKGVIDVADWNDADKLGKGKEMVDRLSNLVAKTPPRPE